MSCKKGAEINDLRAFLCVDDLGDFIVAYRRESCGTTGWVRQRKEEICRWIDCGERLADEDEVGAEGDAGNGEKDGDGDGGSGDVALEGFAGLELADEFEVAECSCDFHDDSESYKGCAEPDREAAVGLQGHVLG